MIKREKIVSKNKRTKNDIFCNVFSKDVLYSQPSIQDKTFSKNLMILYRKRVNARWIQPQFGSQRATRWRISRAK